MQHEVDPSRELVGFLHKFTQLLERQLLDVRETMATTVETVMEGVSGISNATEDKKAHAEKMLESTFINPDVQTEVLIEDLQRFVDEVFEEASVRFEKGQDMEGVVSSEPEVLVRNRIKKLTLRFASDMDSLTALNEDLRNIILGIIGALSSEDVIGQKLLHVATSLKALQTGLNYILTDFDQRCQSNELERVTSGIKNYVFRQYTTEDERQRFRAVFADSRR